MLFTATAQSDIDYPYNPDFENDGFVGIEDVLELLSWGRHNKYLSPANTLTMNRFLTLIFFAVAVTSSASPDFIPSDGLLGLWPLNGSAGDLTGKLCQQLGCRRRLPDDRLGNANSALMLNGTDEYVVIDGPIEVEDFTIALWFLAEQEQYTVQTEVYPLVYVGMDSGISPIAMVLELP